MWLFEEVLLFYPQSPLVVMSQVRSSLPSARMLADGTRMSGSRAGVLFGGGILGAHLRRLGFGDGSCHSQMVVMICCLSEPQLLSRGMLLVSVEELRSLFKGLGK